MYITDIPSIIIILLFYFIKIQYSLFVVGILGSFHKTVKSVFFWRIADVNKLRRYEFYSENANATLLYRKIPSARKLLQNSLNVFILVFMWGKTDNNV